MGEARRGGLLLPGGLAALTGCGCLGAAGLLLEAGARTWETWSWAPWASIAAAFACFGLAAWQARRASAESRAAGRGAEQASRPVGRRILRRELVVFHVGLAAFGAFAGYGAYLLHQRDTGPHVAVTVTRCEVVSAGAASHVGAHAYCHGTWTYRGRRYVDAYVQGAGLDDEGHRIDATLHGDTAYSRDLETPLVLLLVFGAAALVALGLAVSTWRRILRAPMGT
ncbi:MAG TPA: hypothetical protein VHB21_27490 [Minicystis sp.]|nr:hypothetical protein [Minicystis sp.]